MKISDTFRSAGSYYRNHIPQALAFLVIECCMVAATACFSLFLADGGFRWGALLCVPAFILLLLPARQNAADTMQDALSGGSLRSIRLVSTANYGGKLRAALFRTLFVLLWALPLIALVVVVRVVMSGSTDGFTVMRTIMSFGGGKLVNGAVYLLLILAAALVILIIGLGLAAGGRHLYALGSGRILCRKPWKQLLCWLLASLIALLPLLITIAVNVLRYLPALQNLSSVLMGRADLPSGRITLILLGVGALLSLPLLPFRSLVTAVFVRGTEKESKDEA